MDPVEALRRLGGVASFGELMGPTTRAELVAAVSSGSVVKARHDRYALTATDELRLQAVRAGGTLSHLSAAQHWGWKVKFPPLLPCVTLPRNARKPEGKLEVHWQDLADHEVHHDVTRRVATVTACSRAYPYDVALCVADSALREGEVTRSELVADAERAPRTGRAKSLRVAHDADARADNPFETCTRAIARMVPGLSVEPQGRIEGVGRVDLVDHRLKIVIECDSFEFHGKRSGLARDITRYTALARRGYVVVRFSWEEVMFDPDYVRDALLDVVGWRTRQAVHRVA